MHITEVMITHMANLMVTSTFIFFKFRLDSGRDTKENNFIPKQYTWSILL